MAEIKGNYKDYLAITKMTPVEQEVAPLDFDYSVLYSVQSIDTGKPKLV
jgi:hypothetical protein